MSARTLRCLALALVAASLCACWIHVPVGDEETARAMVAAIEKYREKEGRYPVSLQALVPTYLPALPGPDSIQLYHYQRAEDTFAFQYREGLNAAAVYDPRTRTWEHFN
jgi:hypothetical protein